MDRAHAYFSPSAAERWLHCPGSIPLQDHVPSQHKIENKWAVAGTEAHAVFESVLKSKELNINSTEYEEYLKHAQQTLKEVKELVPNWKEYKRVAEKQYHAGEFFGIDDSYLYGFADLVLYSLERKELFIFDYKYGTKKVNPEKNYQLMLYAIGACLKYFPGLNIKDIKITLGILQPRIKNGFQTWRVDFFDFQTTIWFQDFVEGVKAAFGEVTALEEKISELEILTKDQLKKLDWENYFQYGSWCYWCQAKNLCPAWVDQRLDAFEDESEEYGNV